MRVITPDFEIFLSQLDSASFWKPMPSGIGKPKGTEVGQKTLPQASPSISLPELLSQERSP